MFELPGSAITGIVKITKDVVLTGSAPEVVPFSALREKSA